MTIADFANWIGAMAAIIAAIFGALTWHKDRSKDRLLAVCYTMPRQHGWPIEWTVIEIRIFPVREAARVTEISCGNADISDMRWSFRNQGIATPDLLHADGLRSFPCEVDVKPDVSSSEPVKVWVAVRNSTIASPSRTDARRICFTLRVKSRQAKYNVITEIKIENVSRTET